ncbi:LCP family protein [Streptomyces sp. JB150]|uniref:LCP family protein n=1 Tax=Streptomyces sp. JB150 TaxID=2714844 RepID=UPI001409501F|nr:LCP family protein [Streptomyces sp. JB150]QIJ62622.1 LCP family protein [Streptomyces sp. JB150]
MNDRYDAGYGGEDQYRLVGYDEYGRPVYQQAQQQPYDPPYDPYDPYGQQQTASQDHAQNPQGYPQNPQGYGYDPYTSGQQPPSPSYDTYGTGQEPSYGSYDGYAGQEGHGAAYGQQAAAPQSRVAEQTAHIPQQAGPADDAPARDDDRGDRDGQDDRDYRTEQFSFVEEPDGDSEDVIDWLKFTENRTERREEARRRARSRLIALAVVLALVAAGGVGWLWYAGKLPGLSSSDGTTGTTAAAGAQKRDVIVVHLHDTKKGGTSTALLVDNTTTRQGTTVLLPNSLALTGDDGATTTLAKSVEDDGSTGTREALDTVLGTSIQGTWRLDTPYLQNLVDLVGNIEIDTDTDVLDPEAGKGEAPLVNQGEKQTLSGKMAVAYATYRAPGEAPDAQLQRFGQVLQGVLRKMSSDPEAATTTVQTLAQILDPSLTDKDLGTFLAALSDLAKSGDHRTAVLPVQADGTLTAEASDSVVEDVLGGTAKSPDQGAAVRVSVRNASGVKDNTEKARVVLLNGGFTFLESGTAAAQGTSKVLYAEAADRQNATEVAKTLGLPESAVTKGEVTSNANVSVVLGRDYAP